jgi:hypothetical protein
MQCILYKIYFCKVFHMYCKLKCILYALLCSQNFILVKMWVSSGPPWTGLRRRPEELTGARPMGALVDESSPRLLGKNEELVEVRSRASPEVEGQHGGRATAV